MGPSSAESTQAPGTQYNNHLNEKAAEQQLQHADHMPPTISSADVIRIVPRNGRARLAFNELIERKLSGRLGEHHAQYLVATGKGPLENIESLKGGSSDEDTDQGSAGGHNIQQINLGYFRINFECPTISGKGKWTIGRGTSNKNWAPTRNVDMMLAAPDTGHNNILRSTHAYLNLLTESGVWIMSAAIGSSVSSTKDSKGATLSQKATVFLDEKEIFDEEFRCLSKPSTPLTINGMEYLVNFVPKTLEEAQCYCGLRNQVLSLADIDPPKTQITGIPLETDMRAGDFAIFSLGLGSGTFASVYEGFDPVNGELRAVKLFEVKKQSDKLDIEPEIIVLNELGNTPGLIRQYGWCNSNGEQALYDKPGNYQVYIVMERGVAFTECNWSQRGLDILATRLRLFRDLLRGLDALHRKGWMHRDITRQNILFIEARPLQSQPERAALFDFGKLCQSSTDTYTALAAWPNLPPEIEQYRSNSYSQSIDVWMLALTLTHTWFPHVLQYRDRRPSNGQLTIKGIVQIQSLLVKEGSTTAPLANLLSSMLAANPKDRPSARYALTDTCFRNLEETSAKMAKTNDEPFAHS